MFFLAIWLSAALAADKSAQCNVDGETVVFEERTFEDRKGGRGILHPAGLGADLGKGLTAEFRYEHAYGATFVVLDLRKENVVLAEATSWLSVTFDHTTNGSIEQPPKGLPLGALSIKVSVEGRAIQCHGNFL